MKRLFLPFFCLLIVNNLLGQVVSTNEAKEIFQKTVSYLKSSDTSSFVNLWYLDNTGNPHDNTIFDKQQLIQEFKDLQLFLTIPLVKDLPFETIEISEMPAALKAKCKIKAYFKIDDKLSLAYGFLVDYINGKWYLRWHGETTISPKG